MRVTGLVLWARAFPSTPLLLHARFKSKSRDPNAQRRLQFLGVDHFFFDVARPVT